MTPEQFKNSWRDTDQPLSPISPVRLLDFKMQPATNAFLVKAGLPVYASPLISFVEDSDDIFYGIARFTVQFNAGEQKDAFEKYIVIGSCHDGDVIVVNTGDNDKIELLEQNDNYKARFFNTSIGHLAEFLIIYRDFEDDIMKEQGEEGIKNSLFTDEQFELLKERMSAADEEAMTENGFWKGELDGMLAERQDYLNSI
jgi:hypothetical protein